MSVCVDEVLGHGSKIFVGGGVVFTNNQRIFVLGGLPTCEFLVVDLELNFVRLGFKLRPSRTIILF